MSYLARTTPDGRSQKLVEHLLNVANSSKCQVPEKFKMTAYYTGLWHDLGKFSQEWQTYLLESSRDGRKRSHLPHAPQGARYAYELFGFNPISLIIWGHHGELKNAQFLESQGFIDRSESWQGCENIAKSELDLYSPFEIPRINDISTRMLYSVLVDSDRTDARNFGNQYPVKLDINKCFNPICFQSPKFNQRGKIHEIRSKFLDHCTRSAKLEQGLFTLTGACGIGKTIASARFAYDHCKIHNLRGVIYVGSLKSIIEQTADQYRDLFGSENVLEHHSDFVPKDEEIESYKDNSERWDKPVIVTSSVQFYESLFSNKASKCRKLQGIIGKVVLIDESQTIPIGLISPILDALETLVKDWGCTVVLMSATQPVFKNVHTAQFKELIPVEDSKHFFNTLNRVTYHNPCQTKLNWSDLFSDLNTREVKQALIIVNTTALAKEGYQEWEMRSHLPHFHLSSKMCPQHRRDVIAEVKSRLKKGEPCLLISTQVVEAGVDLDFPVVYRQLAPLDSIIQAAGRCNREGKSDRGDFVIFDMEGRNPPGYKLGIAHTKRVLKKYDLNTQMLEAIEKYFTNYYNSSSDTGTEIQKLRRDLNFPTIAEKFKVIDEDPNKVSAIVPYGLGKGLITKFRDVDHISDLDWRQIQQYCVRVSDSSDVARSSNGLYIWTGDYSAVGASEAIVWFAEG